MNRRRLLRRVQQGHVQNVDFADFINLIEGFGFRLRRVRGSHYIFSHPTIPERLNVQEEGGQAKGYQIRELLRYVEQYELELED